MDCRSQEKQASTLIWFYSSNRSEILAAAVRLSTFSFCRSAQDVYSPFLGSSQEWWQFPSWFYQMTTNRVLVTRVW